MGNKITNENFKTLINPTIIPLEVFTSRMDRIKVKCLVCNHEWNPYARKLLEGQGCPECNRLSKMISNEEFVERIHNLSPNIQLLSVYNGRNKKVHCKCKLDEYEWDTSANSLLIGNGCPKCSNNVKRTHEDFVNEINNLNENIIILGKYTTVDNQVKTQCKICDYVWDAYPKVLLYHSGGCPHCYGRNKTQEEFINELYKINPLIDILSKYKGAKGKVLCKCKIDGHIWDSQATNLLQGKGCPVCSSSKGEKFIYNYLVNNNIFFIDQKEFDGLIGLGGGNLSYDFYLPIYNILIEFQGIQHEKPIDFNGEGIEVSQHKFELQLIHDNLKRKYATNNNIRLLEIWYWDFNNIEEILNEELDIKSGSFSM